MNRTSNYLIVVAGATAVGKTDLVINLAKWLDTEVLSADSRQIYQEMNIGTAKPSPSQLREVKHHFVNELSVVEAFTAADFARQGLQRLESIFRHRKVAIVAGGTGLYIDALCYGLDQIPDVETLIRDQWEKKYHEEGLEVLQIELQRLDPVYAQRVDLNNHRRIIRALSVIESTGSPYSSFLNRTKEPRPFEIVQILLEREREELYKKINLRIDEMIRVGLEDEVRKLMPYSGLPALQTVGYQEWWPYFAGERDRIEVIRLIKRNSRRYAKRQLTWFRKHGYWHTFSPEQHQEIKDLVQRLQII